MHVQEDKLDVVKMATALTEPVRQVGATNTLPTDTRYEGYIAFGSAERRCRTVLICDRQSGSNSRYMGAMRLLTATSHADIAY